MVIKYIYPYAFFSFFFKESGYFIASLIIAEYIKLKANKFLCSFDASEYGVEGSTAFVQEFKAVVFHKAAAVQFFY